MYVQKDEKLWKNIFCYIKLPDQLLFKSIFKTWTNKQEAIS